jgi:dolichyl-diphosphooligosaccharide--protein glycosyltransferase
LIADVTGAATFNDGEAPDPLVHYLFARAIASSDPRELGRIVSLLSTYGRSDLHAALDDRRDPQAAIDALLRREARTAGNVVLLLTERDVPPFPAFFRTGHWDFSRGAGPEDGYVTGDCESFGKHVLRCSDSLGGEFAVDLANGRMSGGRPLRRVVDIRGGVVVRTTEHSRQARLSLELVARERPGFFTAYVVSEPVFESNFNQLYLLGRFDPSLFDEIYRAPPVMRAFRIRQQAAQAPSHRRVPPRRGPRGEGE